MRTKSISTQDFTEGHSHCGENPFWKMPDRKYRSRTYNMVAPGRLSHSHEYIDGIGGCYPSLQIGKAMFFTQHEIDERQDIDSFCSNSMCRVCVADSDSVHIFASKPHKHSDKILVNSPTGNKVEIKPMGVLRHTIRYSEELEKTITKSV